MKARIEMSALGAASAGVAGGAVVGASAGATGPFCGRAVKVAVLNLGGDQIERMRADLAFEETPANGALFATSSIAWCGSLSPDNYDNVSRIARKVVRRFMDPAPVTNFD